MSSHICHQCGMDFPRDLDSCPKCDYGVFEQNQSKIYTQDIAHARQTIEQASAQFYQTLDTARQQNFGYLRLIVGGGLIKNEVGHLLETEQWRGNIQRFELEQPNTGAYLIKMR